MRGWVGGLRAVLRRLTRAHLLLILGAAVILAAAAGSVTVYRGFSAYRKANPRARLGDIVGALQNQSDQPGTLAYKIHHGQRVNILMLGYGGTGHDGAYLTDSILVISIQGPDRVTLTSVPRDSYVRIKAFADGGEYDGKMNTAYEIGVLDPAFGKVAPQYAGGFSGGGALASSVIGDYLGITIDYWVGVDFSAFRQVVDAVGGVDVVNPYVLDDSEYPLGETNDYTHIHFDAGPLHLDGEHALVYVRERHADSDFGRSRRQQQVVAAIKDKALSLGALPKLYSLFDSFGDNVKTNMTLSDLRVFGGVAGGISTPSTHHVSVDNLNFQYDTLDAVNGYILLARDRTFGNLHRFVQAEMVDPKVLAEGARVQLVATPGQASEGQSFGGVWTSLLGMLSFNMLSPGVGAHAPAGTEVHDYSGGRATATARWLAAFFGGTVITETAGGGPTADPAAPPQGVLPSPLPSASPAPADIVVVLGTDFSVAFDNEDHPVYLPPPNYVPPPVVPRHTAAPSPSATFEASPAVSPPASPVPSAQPSPQPSAPQSPPPSPPPPSPSPHPSPSP